MVDTMLGAIKQIAETELNSHGTFVCKFELASIIIIINNIFIIIFSVNFSVGHHHYHYQFSAFKNIAKHNIAKQN